MTAALRWEDQTSRSAYGFSGDVRIAMVVQQADDRRWIVDIDGVRSKWLSPSLNGATFKYRSTAIAAVDRFWADWLRRADLAEAPPLPNEHN